MNKPVLTLNNISKHYIDKVGYNINLLNKISLSLNTNEFLTILAPRGSGKTSLLKIISGLEQPTNGVIETNGNKLIFIPTKPSSFPWLNVRENISFNSNLSSERISEIIDLVGLNGYTEHFPHNKSEGFRFRIALGRALANMPDVLVIDEPFANLNSRTREEIYLLLRTLYNSEKLTIIFGTTNITEAIFLSDKIYLMKKNPGEIIGKLIVDLEEKRELPLMESKEFQTSRNQIEEIFKTNLERALYNFSV
jgi:ABC-type nitrate/sulfonate/bicarbonate transport system ATPase subunit